MCKEILNNIFPNFLPNQTVFFDEGDAPRMDEFIDPFRPLHFRKLC